MQNATFANSENKAKIILMADIICYSLLSANKVYH